MLPDRVSNPGPLTYESGALPIALRGPATRTSLHQHYDLIFAVNKHPYYKFCSHSIMKTMF